MIAAATSYGFMIGTVRVASLELPPFQVAFFRNFFSLAVLAPWLIRVGGRAFHTRRLGMQLLRAGFAFATMACLFTALALIPLATATAVTFAAPLFATAGGALILGETVRIRRWMATLVGFAGVLIVLRPDTVALDFGTLMAMLAALFMAGSMLSMRSLGLTDRPSTTVAIMTVGTLVLSAGPAAWVWHPVPDGLWVWLAALGLLAVTSQIFLTRAFAAAEASAISPFDFFRLVSAAVIGMVFYGENPDIWTWVGSAVIFGAGAYIARREAMLARQRRAARPA